MYNAEPDRVFAVIDAATADGYRKRYDIYCGERGDTCHHDVFPCIYRGVFVVHSVCPVVDRAIPRRIVRPSRLKLRPVLRVVVVMSPAWGFRLMGQPVVVGIAKSF